MTSAATKFHIFIATCVMCVLSAAPALAGGYVTWTPGPPPQSDSPHHGFTTSTTKCEVCHAVHGANPAGAVLLRTDVASACNYCHVNTAAAPITQVYESDDSKYKGTDYENAHNSYSVLGVEQGVTCTQCHQVHAADNMMSSNAYLTDKLLRGAKTDDGTWDPMAGRATSSDTSDTALTKWCARCHFTGLNTPYPYYRNDYNAPSHVMTAAADIYDNDKTLYSGRIAWVDSTQCSSCHASGYRTAAWPHYTAGAYFLVKSAYATDTPVPATNGTDDGVCLRCHHDSAGNGVGKDF